MVDFIPDIHIDDVKHILFRYKDQHAVHLYHCIIAFITYTEVSALNRHIRVSICYYCITLDFLFAVVSKQKNCLLQISAALLTLIILIFQILYCLF